MNTKVISETSYPQSKNKITHIIFIEAKPTITKDSLNTTITNTPKTSTAVPAVVGNYTRIAPAVAAPAQSVASHTDTLAAVLHTAAVEGIPAVGDSRNCWQAPSVDIPGSAAAVCN